MNFLLLGLDSFIVCLAVGPLIEKRWRLLYASLFGVADGVGFLLGAGLGWQFFSDGVSTLLQTAIVVGMGLYLLVVVAGTQQKASSWPLWVWPHLLIFDNLVYGLTRDGSLLQQAGQQALSSALMAIIGLLVAVAVRPALARHASPNRIAGAGLLVAAGALAVVG